MIRSTLLENPAFVGLVVAIPSAALGYLGYRRSRHNDEVAERAGVATSQHTSIGQVIEAQDMLIANLREEVVRLNAKLDRIIEKCEGLERQLAALGANP